MGSLTEDQKQALLESLEKLCSIFWGPNLEKCREMSADERFISFEVLDEVLYNNNSDIIKNIIIILSDFPDAESLFDFLEETDVRLFINTRCGISAPLYHSCYPESDQTDASFAIMGKTAVYMKQRFESKEKRLSGEAVSFAETFMLPWVSRFYDRLVAEQDRTFNLHAAAILKSTLSLVARIR